MIFLLTLPEYCLKKSNMDNSFNSYAQLLLEKSLIYKTLSNKLSELGNEPLETNVKKTIHDAAQYACDRSRFIIVHMKEYTLHDEKHLANVLHLMEKIIPKDLLNDLNIPELMLLILSAFFHDLGMAPSQEDTDSWLGNFNENTASPERMSKKRLYEKYKNSFPEKNQRRAELVSAQKYHEVALLDNLILSDFIRSNHANKVREIIACEYSGEIKFGNTDLKNNLIKLCESHGSPTNCLSNFESSFPCGNGIYACLPFVGVILRLSDLLDFDTSRTPEILFNTINVSNSYSLEEWRKHFTVQNWDISNKKILYHCLCKHPSIEYAINLFFDQIDAELVSCKALLSNMKDNIRQHALDKYNIQLPISVDRSKVGPIINLSTGKPEYRYNNIQFALNKGNIFNILMGSSLYGNKIVVLRELLQNSIDTCLLRKAISDINGYQYIPCIKVYLDKKNKQLIIEDNGMGMNENDINEYYSKIGTSFYKSKEFYDIKSENDIKFTPISRFGIGILSCFMVSNSIEIETKKIKGNYNTDDSIQIKIDGYSSIFFITESQLKDPGTITRLKLKDDFFSNNWQYVSEADFRKSVIETLQYPPFDIEIHFGSSKYSYNKDYLLSVSPMKFFESSGWRWALDNNEVLKLLSLDLNFPELGFFGKADIIILEKDEIPSNIISYPQKEIIIENESFRFDFNYSYGLGKIINNTGNLGINKNGQFYLQTYPNHFCPSFSSFSILGIEYPGHLFPLDNQPTSTCLKWPFPMLLILNYGGGKDLDLNSARNEIIENRKWDEFEINLSYAICLKIAEVTSVEYWKKLYEIIQFLKISSSDQYNRNFYLGVNNANTQILNLNY